MTQTSGSPSTIVQSNTAPVYISFTAEVNPTTTEQLLSSFGQLINQGVSDVTLLLSSPGGTTREGIAIYNTLRAMPINLTTHNVGQVNSITNVIYLAGDKRYACATASFMFHGVGISLPQNSRLEEKDLREKLDNISNDQSLITDIIVDRASIEAEKLSSLFLQAAFMRSDEALEHGIVHEIRDPVIPGGAKFFQLTFKR